MKQCLWWVYCRRHSFAHGLDESSVSYSSLILYQPLRLVRLSYHLISYFCHLKYIYSVNSFFYMFFPPCAYTMCYVLIAFIQPFPIYQALFAQYYIFSAAATTWNPSFYICEHFFPANNRFVSTYSLFAIKLGFLVLCYSLQNILIFVWHCVKSKGKLEVILKFFMSMLESVPLNQLLGLFRDWSRWSCR